MTPIRFDSIMPEMPVQNLSAAVQFYTEVLGFGLEYLHGDEYAVMAREKVRIGLMRTTADAPAGSGRAYCFVTSSEELFETVRQGGARVTEPLERRSYGLKDFAIRDPDGNRIAFAEYL